MDRALPSQKSKWNNIDVNSSAMNISGRKIMLA